MVDTDNTRRTTDDGQRHGYGIHSPQVSYNARHENLSHTENKAYRPNAHLSDILIQL